MEFEATRDIAASADAVWRVLTNASAYPEWEPNVTRIDGDIRPGAKITVHTRLSKQAFPVRVTEFDAPSRMTWTGGMPLGLFKGVRTFTLESAAEGVVRFHMCEVFSGPLLGIIGKSIPDLSESFEEFAEGLKSRAEAGSG